MSTVQTTTISEEVVLNWKIDDFLEWCQNLAVDEVSVSKTVDFQLPKIGMKASFAVEIGPRRKVFGADEEATSIHLINRGKVRRF
jgi:hypothetical protein